MPLPEGAGPFVWGLAGLALWAAGGLAWVLL